MRSGRSINILLVLMLFSAYQFFYLIPFKGIKGIFNITDIGLLLILLFLLWSVVVRRQNLLLYKNIFTLFIILYLFLVTAQAGLALIFYGQSILDGLIRAHHQLYYFSFLFFLNVFNGRENTNKAMSYLTVFSLIAIGLSLINYFGPDIFRGEIAERIEIRAGIQRATIPGLQIIVATGLWHLVRYVEDNKASVYSLLFFLLTFVMALFKQTRGRIIALSITALILLIRNRQYKLVGSISVLMMLAVAIMSVTMEENLLTNPFVQSYGDISKGTGTVAARLSQVEEDWKIIKEYPIFGNSGMVLRGDSRTTQELFFAAYGADLGYMHWIKYFGIVGVIWLSLFITVFYVKLVRLLKEPTTDKVMAKFSGYLFTYIVIGAITLDFFTIPRGILITCMAIAILLNSRGASVNETR